MKIAKFAILILLACIGLQAHAKPFEAEEFEALKQQSEKILLHFHADWCPTCKVQSNILEDLRSNGDLEGIALLTVDYDNAQALREQLRIVQQSTFVAFYGDLETGRRSGITSRPEIRSFVSENLKSLTLQDRLDIMNESISQRLTPEQLRTMRAATDRLRSSQLEENALRAGAAMPDFSLPNAHGEDIRLSALLESGPVIVTFFRGSWCPYCNAHLSAYQEHLEDFESLGASLVAITPEKPDLTVLTQTEKDLRFPILTDENNELANQFGLVFEVPPELEDLYRNFGIDLAESQGNEAWKLPVPATYIVTPNRHIFYSFVDVDYTNRADPETLIEELRRLQEK